MINLKTKAEQRKFNVCYSNIDIVNCMNIKNQLFHDSYRVILAGERTQWGLVLRCEQRD